MKKVECGKEVSIEEPCNTKDKGSEKSDYVKKSTSIFMTIPNENMKKIDTYIKMLRFIGDYKYLLVGQHDGPKLEHYHIYCQYKENHTFHSMNFDFAHIKKISSPAATVKYIKCQDKKHIKKGVECFIYLEEGEPPHQGARSLKELMKLNQEERKDLAPCQLLSLIKCENIMNEENNVDAWLKVQHIEVEWHTGEPGSGKTYYAKKIGREYRQIGKNIMIVEYDKNGFAHKLGNENAQLLILNEFRDSCMKFTDFLEITSNEHQYNTKHGGFFMPNLERIIITSVQTPYEIYKNVQENRNQIYRRISKIYKHIKIHTDQGDKFECVPYEDDHDDEHLPEAIDEIDWNKLEAKWNEV